MQRILTDGLIVVIEFDLSYNSRNLEKRRLLMSAIVYASMRTKAIYINKGVAMPIRFPPVTLSYEGGDDVRLTWASTHTVVVPPMEPSVFARPSLGRNEIAILYQDTDGVYRWFDPQGISYYSLSIGKPVGVYAAGNKSAVFTVGGFAN